IHSEEAPEPVVLHSEDVVLIHVQRLCARFLRLRKTVLGISFKYDEPIVEDRIIAKHLAVWHQFVDYLADLAGCVDLGINIDTDASSRSARRAYVLTYVVEVLLVSIIVDFIFDCLNDGLDLPMRNRPLLRLGLRQHRYRAEETEQ